MINTTQNVANHYSLGDVETRIRRGLEALGKDMNALQVDDLSAVDEFHIRGRVATEELATWAQLSRGESVLDVGCGIGGTARFLAHTRGCNVTGIDVTPEYVEVASRMSSWVGMEEKTRFETASALDLPFEDGAFDVVWTEHVQMNIADKIKFYSEISRVLKPGGRLLFHDIFAGSGTAEFRYPVPWAYGAEVSALVYFDEVRSILRGLGFTTVRCEEKTTESADFFDSALERFETEMPRLGINLLMGDSSIEKFANLRDNMKDGLLRVFMAVMERQT